MNHWWFLFRLKHKDIVRAIGEAEKLTSGEVRVFVSHKHCDDVNAEAAAQFEKLGMTRTRHRNGVLIFVAPRSRKFAILGDEGIHAKCGDAFWQALADTMSAAFKANHISDGLVQTIQRAGALLAEHFPRGDDDRNELPDEIAH